jgi:hypothetical protein
MLAAFMWFAFLQERFRDLLGMKGIRHLIIPNENESISSS